MVLSRYLQTLLYSLGKSDGNDTWVVDHVDALFFTAKKESIVNGFIIPIDKQPKLNEKGRASEFLWMAIDYEDQRWVMILNEGGAIPRCLRK